MFSVVDIGYYPRESNVVTFRDPFSFPVLYHPECNNLVDRHLQDLAERIVTVCVALEEYPTIRYWRPRSSAHQASIICSHLAMKVQSQIDMYATYHSDFPPASSRPRGVLYILDRSLDLIAPVVHEFTYQAMVHDLLPVKEGEKVTYRMKVNEGESNQADKDVEISEKDRIWTTNRHMHMKDTIEKLMGDFQRFLDENPHFTNQSADNATSLAAIKDMMAGLPEFQEMKEAYSLHLTMAQECMNQFQARKMPDLASLEQSLATGLDEDHKKPKGMADQIVRSLDEEGVSPADRLRLIMLYLLYRDGILPADLSRLLAHARLPARDGDAIRNLSLLGARTTRPLKDNKSHFQPVFPPKSTPTGSRDEYSLSRFEPNLKLLLEQHTKNSLDHELFPSTKPQMDHMEIPESVAHTSLRSAKPTWAKSRATNEPRQRIIVFMAGGASYSESRACYEISRDTGKDVYLATTHMLSPALFIRQLCDLSRDRRSLNIPMTQAKPQAPRHVLEPDEPPQAAKPRPPAKDANRPPTAQMNEMKLNGGQNGASRPSNARVSPQPSRSRPSAPPAPPPEEEKKKKKGLFHRSKK